MPRFSQVTEAVAPPEVLKVYRDFKAKMGFPDVPSFIATLGGSPPTLAGTCCLFEHMLMGGALPRATKELIFLAVAADRECTYCREAHAACCRMLGVDDATIEAVSHGLRGELPDGIREILLFAIKCAAAPEELSEDDFGHLRRHELAEQEILEVITCSALAVYTTIIADATLLEPDAHFAAVDK